MELSKSGGMEKSRNCEKAQHFVLVHGAGHGSWCWYKVQHLLEKAGHRVTSIDLAGGGSSTIDPNTILSFHDYTMPLIEFLSQLSISDKVVLVGHSAGGLSLTYATHLFSDKIRVAIYIAATMLPAGFCSEQDVQMGVPQLYEVYEFQYGLGPNNPPTSTSFRKGVQQDLLYQLSPVEDVALASLLLRPAPCLAFKTARFDGPAEGGGMERVPRVYIKTLQDRVLKSEQQEAMIKRWPPNSVFCLDTDHSPFFSAPRALYRMLLNATSNYSKTNYLEAVPTPMVYLHSQKTR